MGRAQGRSILSQSIAEILGTAPPPVSRVEQPGPLRKSLIYTSMALLAINPAAVNAVGLGELNVNSQLGQPLDATIPITLGRGESLPRNCVAPAHGSSGLDTPSKLQVSTPAATQPGTYSLRVTTTNALHEPMYEISLLIDCPGTPLLMRQYMLMLDLPGMEAAPVPTVNGRGDTLTVPSASTQSTSNSVAQPTTPATTQTATRSLQQSRSAIPAGQPYRIREGDTLSTIAARIDGRVPDTTWSVANAIFAANPHAFIRNNPNLIKLGSRIDIPDVESLAGLKPGHQPIVSTAVAEPATDPAELVHTPQPTPAPIPAPVAAPIATTRPEVFVTEPEPAVPNTTDITSINIDEAVTTDKEVIQPFVTQPSDEPAASEGNEPFITPFLDEQATPLATVETVDVESGATDEPVTEPVPAITTIPQSEPTDNTINPLLAIFVGLLLGALVSLLALRRQLVDAIMGLLPQRKSTSTHRTKAAQTSLPKYADNSAAGTETFDTSVAKSAFITHHDEMDPLPIGNPAEDTYIVETSPTEATIGEMEAPDLAAAKTAKNPGTPTASPADEMLAQLFSDDSSAANDSQEGIFDPTGGIDAEETGTFLGPTAEMPVQAGEPDFDPTAQLPAEFAEQTFDPTAGMLDGQPDLLLDELTETPIDLEDADEMFSTASNMVDDFLDSSPTAEITDEATLQSELANMQFANQDGMSETLNEALSLLESNFEEEFTASQILERSQINRALDKAKARDAEADDDEANDDEGTDTLSRNVIS